MLAYQSVLSLKLTASLPVKIGGWEIFSFSVGSNGPIFKRELLVSGGQSTNLEQDGKGTKGSLTNGW